MSLSTLKFSVSAFVLVLIIICFTKTISAQTAGCLPPEDSFTNLSKWRTTGSMVGQVTTVDFLGKRAIRQNYTDTNSNLLSTHSFCSGFFGSIMIDFYDNGDSTKGTLFAVYSGDVATQSTTQMEMIGLGVWSSLHNNTYAYRVTNTGDPAAATISSGIPRSTGWHTFELVVTPEGAYGAIDGASLAWITTNSLNTNTQFKSQGARSIGLVSTWGLASDNYYARLRSRPLASTLSNKFGFFFSGSVQPPHLYPDTFSELGSNWSSSYAPSYDSVNITNIPLTTKNQTDGHWHVVNITCCGHAENGGVTKINITPWTRPTMFNVYSRARLQEFVNHNGPGTYYAIGSEPNVLTNDHEYGQMFDFGNHPHWDWGYWGWAINGGGSFAYDSSDSTQGEQSMRMTASSGGQNWLKSHQIPVSPNKKYRVKVAIKTDNVQAATGQGAGLHIYENDRWPGTAAGGGKTTMLTGTNGWRDYTFDFTTQSTTNRAHIYIGLGFGGNATGTVRFDNISFSAVNADNTSVADTAILNSNTGKRFAAIYNYYAKTIKELDPKATIVGPNFLTFSGLPGGSTSGAYGPYIPGRVWFDEFITEHTARYGSKPTFDIYATHVYDNLRPWNLASYVQYAKDTIADFRSYVNTQYGTTSKVWISEFGVQTPNVSDANAAQFMKEMNAYLVNRRDIDKWFWAWTYANPSGPFSGYLYTGNLQSSAITATGQQFKQLSVLHAGLVGGRQNPADDNYDGYIEKNEWLKMMSRFYDQNVILDTDNNSFINSLDFAKAKQLPLR